ncbi:MAG: hypothetical protein AAGA12_00765 [Pseudomonadota bacterium]
MLKKRSEIGSFPEVSIKDAVTLVTQCADITLQLSVDGQIIDVFCSSQFDAKKFGNWIGRSFGEVVTPDSAPKVAGLLADNAASEDNEGRWRHLNLELIDGESMPLLLKYFKFEKDGVNVAVVTGRDLGPMVDAQARFQKELLMLERERATSLIEGPLSRPN